MDVVLLIAFVILVLMVAKHFYEGRSVSLAEPEPIVAVHEPVEKERLPIEKGVTSRCLDMAHSHADIGTVYPLRVDGSEYTIVPFQKAQPDVQAVVVEKLHVLNPDLTIAYILEHWCGSDVFYVMVGAGASDFIGAVAVDRKNFEPFMSHLYVDEAFRKRGYGERLVEHAIEYARAFKFKTLSLWCEAAMIPYYRKAGWVVEKELAERSMWIMTKALS
jgi:GNAT superfamily N-acetyltransferase